MASELNVHHVGSDERWIQELTGDHPYQLLASTLPSNPQSARPFRAAACFPWSMNSVQDLFNGEFSKGDKLNLWKSTVNKWKDVIAVGGGKTVRLFVTRPPYGQPYEPLFTINVPDPEADISAIAWCMAAREEEIWPFLAFSGNSILYVYNVESGTYHGVLRGHGGRITSLVVHAIDPCIICSTAHDHTVRIYNLRLSVNYPIQNPSWPGSDKPCLGGPAFGLPANEGEGEGYGRCVAILAGGSSGGHQAPVLSAAFHPTYPIIATSGMDNTVKLWRMPSLEGDKLIREDKPLFSSSRIHSAQVLSINWMSQDILLSHNGPVVHRQGELKQLIEVPGSIVLWRWLGFDRFFPPDKVTWPAVIRGCGSDYQESSSFKIISVHELPTPVFPARIHVHQSPLFSPLILIPSLGCIKMASPIHFKPRNPPPFPDADDKLARAASQMHIGDASRIAQMPQMSLWEIEAGEMYQFEACAMTPDRKVLVGVGAQAGTFVWCSKSEFQ